MTERKGLKILKKKEYGIEDYFNNPTKEYWMGKRVRVYKIFMRMRMDNIDGADDYFYWEEVNVDDVQKVENIKRRHRRDWVHFPGYLEYKYNSKPFVNAWITGFGTIQNGVRTYESEVGWVWTTKKVLKCVKIRFNVNHKEFKIPLDGFDLEHPF